MFPKRYPKVFFNYKISNDRKEAVLLFTSGSSSVEGLSGDQIFFQLQTDVALGLFKKK